MKKKNTKNDSVNVKLVAGNDEVLNLKLNDFENSSQVNETLNGMVKIVSAAIIGSALTMLAHDDDSTLKDLPMIVDKLYDKFADNCKEFMLESIQQTLQQRLAKEEAKKGGQA